MLSFTLNSVPHVYDLSMGVRSMIGKLKILLPKKDKWTNRQQSKLNFYLPFSRHSDTQLKQTAHT